jgi:hypothetical protein
MSFLDDVKMYTRFIWGLRAFLSRTISLEEAKAIIRQRMAEREKNFLRLVERVSNYELISCCRMSVREKTVSLSIFRSCQCVH